MIGGSRSKLTLSTLWRERQLSDDDFGLDDFALEPELLEPEPLEPEPLEPEPLEPEPLEPEVFAPELSDFVADDELSLEEEPLSELELLESLVVDDAAVVDAGFLPRLSVLKKPEPLKVTPTGVKTFLTGNISPESGWAISVRLSSWKPCWTSMVSPVSTNLYT